MSSGNNFGFPYRSPPPSPPPPPPHVLPPPPPLTPSPSPDSHTKVIVIVFISFGGVLFLSFLAATLCCFIKKKKKKSNQEAEIVHVDEHLKVKEAIVPLPHGPQVLVLDIEDDLHADEIKKKDDKDGIGTSHTKLIEEENKSIGGIEVVEEASSPSGLVSNVHSQHEHKA